MATDNHLPFFASLKGKMLLIFLGLSVIPLTLFGVFLYTQSEATLHQRIANEMSTAVVFQKAAVEQYLDERVQDIVTLAETKRIRSMNPADVTEAAQAFYNLWKIYEDILVVDLNGDPLYNSRGNKLSVNDREYFIQASSGKTVVSDALVSRATNNIIVAVAAPVKKDDGEVIGVAIGTVAVTTLRDLMAIIQTGETGEAYMINQAGYLVTPSRFEKDLLSKGIIKERSELELQVNTLAAKDVIAGNSGVKTYPDYLNNSVIGAYTPVDSENHWAIIMEQNTDEAFESIYRIRNIMIIAELIIILLVVVLAIVFSGSLANPLIFISQRLNTLSLGDISRQSDTTAEERILKRKDEYGIAGRSMQSMESYLHDLVGNAEEIASGNLTVEVKSRSEKDGLGNALKEMVKALRELVGEVSTNAFSLEESSGTLADSVTQTSETVNQISMTIQEVTSGITQQTDSTTRTAAAADQMAKAVEGVANGANEQSKAISLTYDTIKSLVAIVMDVNQGTKEQAERMVLAGTSMGDMMDALSSVDDLSAQVTSDAGNTTRTANEGGSALNEAIQGIELVQDTTETLATRVAEFGKRASQIGLIADTIDDIATQTNLLSLNAAIEAARAGEHGKGFAVVADEVRKLADRTTQATKEISSMILNMQGGIQDVEHAMQTAGREVTSTVIKANHAGDSFAAILGAMDNLTSQIQEIRYAVNNMQEVSIQVKVIVDKGKESAEINNTAAEDMASRSDEIMSSLDSVSAVVEENNAAAEEMAATTTGVSEAVESIASIAEENSAAMEEVSASTEEISAQMDTLTVSAQSLSSMAQTLLQLVTKFKLN